MDSSMTALVDGRKYSASYESPRSRTGSTLIALAAEVFCLFFCGGCQHQRHEEAEHHVPAHMPADFPAAVARLQALHHEVRYDQPRQREELDVWTEMLDVVQWLPALAADSDLPEGPWNHAADASRRFEELLRPVLGLPLTERSAAYLSRLSSVELLHQELRDVRALFPMRASNSQAEQGEESASVHLSEGT